MSDLPIGLCSHPDCLATHIALQIQGNSVCIDHIDWGMSQAMAPLKQMLASGAVRQAPSKQLNMMFDLSGDSVVVKFDRDVAWIAFTPQEAADFATQILRSGCILASKTKTSLVFKVPGELRHHSPPVPAGDGDG